MYIYIFTKKIGKISIINNFSHKIFLCSSNINIKFDIHRSCNFIIGQGTFVAGLRVSGGFFICSICKNCLFSDNILFQMGDQHIIYDIISGNLNNYFETTTTDIGIHCWLGRGCTVLEGILMADSTILGTHSVLTKSTKPFCVYAGCPAKLINTMKTWMSKKDIPAYEQRIIKELFIKHKIEGTFPLQDKFKDHQTLLED